MNFLLGIPFKEAEHYDDKVMRLRAQKPVLLYKGRCRNCFRNDNKTTEIASVISLKPVNRFRSRPATAKAEHWMTYGIRNSFSL
jgi:hypothetical protein